MKRCCWVKETDALMCAYHDEEYGRKKGSDRELFEKLCLECFQAGLSWRTVLYKREALRRCFYGFSIEKAAAMSASDVERLMQETAIVRNRRKIEAVISNARAHLKYFPDEGSFGRYVYSFVSGDELSADLKAKGYSFAGPTICTSFLESVGAKEAHEKTCFLYNALTKQT